MTALALPVAPDASPRVAESVQRRVIVAPGQLVIGSRQAFKRAVLDAIADGATEVAVDMGGCGYADASGLGVLVGCAKRCREAGGALTLWGVQAEMAEYLALTKLDTVLAVHTEPGPEPV